MQPKTGKSNRQKPGNRVLLANLPQIVDSNCVKKLFQIFRMIKIFNLNIFITCVCLFLVGCGEIKSGEEKTPTSSRVKAPTELIKHAISRQEVGAYDEAIDILDQILSANSQYAPAYYQKGLIYEEWDKRQEALKAYKKAIQINPTYDEARLGLASLYGKSVLNDLALEQLLKVAETRGDDPELHFKIALEYWYLQDIPRSSEHYLRVIEISPEHLQAHLNLISVYEKLENWEKALEEIQIVKQLSSKTQNEHAMRIAKNKSKFIEGRMDLTKQDIKRKSEPPFD